MRKVYSHMRKCIICKYLISNPRFHLKICGYIGFENLPEVGSVTTPFPTFHVPVKLIIQILSLAFTSASCACMILMRMAS